MSRRIVLASLLTSTALALGVGAAVAMAPAPPINPSTEAPDGPSYIDRWLDQGGLACFNTTKYRTYRADNNIPDFAPTTGEEPVAPGLGSMARGGSVGPGDWHGDVVVANIPAQSLTDADRKGGGRGWGADPRTVYGDMSKLPAGTPWRDAYETPDRCEGSPRDWHRGTVGALRPNHAEFWVVEGHAPDYLILDNDRWVTIYAKPSAPDHFTDSFRYRYRTSDGWSNVATVTVQR